MSLILDALKKSDQNRSRGKVPDLQADHSQIVADPPRRRVQRWLWPSLGLFLLLAGGGSWLLWPTEEPVPPQAAVTRQAIPVVPPPSPPATIAEPAPTAAAPPVPAKVAPPPAPKAAPAARPAPRPATAAAPVPPDATVYAWANLPAHIRQGLPQLTISLHYFTPDPSARMVRINGRILREGSELSGGVRIEEIQRNGILCTAQGVHFLLPTTGGAGSDEEAR